jgi:hypothetical protein
MTPDAKKKLLARATRAMRELKKGEATGYIGDGSGRRYRVAFDWFDAKFPDDTGEPIFYLYGALAAHRQGEAIKARIRLANAMLGNLFLLPYLSGMKIDAAGIWFSSNRHEASYLTETREYLDEPTDEERAWIASEWNTSPYVTLREGYVSTFRALNEETHFLRRAFLLSRWESLRAKQLAKVQQNKGGGGN